MIGLSAGALASSHNWPTMANEQEEYRGNPPGPVYPTFYSGTSTPPLLAFGTSNTAPPFGFAYPSLPAGQLDSAGGIVGPQNTVGAINPNLKSPVAYNYSASVERKIGSRLVGSVIYSGTRATDLLSGGGQQFNVNYGVDINSYPGDLIQHNSLIPTRLNQSFGQILYTTNDRYSSYNGLIVSVRERFGDRGFVTASYTRSSSKDDTQVYPTWTNPGQYYGPSVWESPNRFSLAWNYTLPGLNSGHGFWGRTTSGWSLTGTTSSRADIRSPPTQMLHFSRSKTQTGFSPAMLLEVRITTAMAIITITRTSPTMRRTLRAKPS